MRDILIIFVVLLVLLLIISTLGGAVSFKPEKFDQTKFKASIPNPLSLPNPSQVFASLNQQQGFKDDIGQFAAPIDEEQQKPSTFKPELFSDQAVEDQEGQPQYYEEGFGYANI